LHFVALSQALTAVLWQLVSVHLRFRYSAEQVHCELPSSATPVFTRGRRPAAFSHLAEPAQFNFFDLHPASTQLFALQPAAFT
jgi:hypothetical protein